MSQAQKQKMDKYYPKCTKNATSYNKLIEKTDNMQKLYIYINRLLHKKYSLDVSELYQLIVKICMDVIKTHSLDSKPAHVLMMKVHKFLFLEESESDESYSTDEEESFSSSSDDTEYSSSDSAEDFEEETKL